MRGRREISILVLAATIATVGACTSRGDDEPLSGDSLRGTTTEPLQRLERPAGPAAELAGPLPAEGAHLPATAAAAPDLDAAGYAEEEYTAEGVASSYRSRGALPPDGRYELVKDEADRYRTRIVVRRPADAGDFNGTVVVEWLNVSGGVDAAPDYGYMADEVVRGGYAWVGVSAQHLGIEGGPVAVAVAGLGDTTGIGLRRLDPERYGSLTHPGDAFSYDIYTQVARALRAPADVDALDGLEPERLLAVGDSQSAFTLTTYANGVQPLTEAFDGFLIHSRGGAAAPLGKAGRGIDIAGTIAGPPTRVRTDVGVPVLVLETETDVLSFLNYHPARQPDSRNFRLWEVAGTAHADAYQLGPVADVVDCPAPVNTGAHHFVAKAALHGLDAWVRTGEAPPEAARLETDSTPDFVRDANGNALGGVRTPQVDVPVATLSGEPGGSSSIMCLLQGSTTPLDPGRLAQLYPTVDAYLAAYAAAADAAIGAGFVLEDDREALLADADPSVIPAARPPAT
jgi:hypothetical protein